VVILELEFFISQDPNSQITLILEAIPTLPIGNPTFGLSMVDGNDLFAGKTLVLFDTELGRAGLSDLSHFRIHAFESLLSACYSFGMVDVFLKLLT
jgi:hypothetical protein